MLDFSSRKRAKLPVTFENGEKVTVLAPKKKMVSRFLGFHKKQGQMDETAIFEELPALIVDALNSNEQGKKYTVEDIDKLMDIEEMMLFLTAYSEFLTSVLEDPNTKSLIVQQQ